MFDSLCCDKAQPGVLRIAVKSRGQATVPASGASSSVCASASCSLPVGAPSSFMPSVDDISLATAAQRPVSEQVGCVRERIRARPAQLPDGVGLPEGNTGSTPNIASEHYTGLIEPPSTSPSVHFAATPLSYLPPTSCTPSPSGAADAVRELEELHKSGLKVVFPQRACTTFQAPVHRHPRPSDPTEVGDDDTVAVRSTADVSTVTALADLQDLCRSGCRVVWPKR